MVAVFTTELLPEKPFTDDDLKRDRSIITTYPKYLSSTSRYYHSLLLSRYFVETPYIYIYTCPVKNKLNNE